MRGTTCLFCLFVLVVSGCREESSQKSPAANASKAKDQAVAVPESTHAPKTNPQPPSKAAWTPPANPDPHQILGEAQADATAGRYEEALAKHVWFNRNALQHKPSLSGVRLSFALMYWKQLGVAYPPAKAKLIEIRDEAEKQVTSGNNVRESFQDFAGINSSLGDDKRTATLFTALDKNNPNVAKEAFALARPALIKAGETKLCGKYVDPKDYEKQVAMYRRMIGLESAPHFGKEHTEFAQKNFANEVSTMVALLVLSDRKTEAEKIAADAKTVWDDKAFSEDLGKALEGKVPEPWPPAAN